MVATPRVTENLEVAAALIANAATQGAQLVALPEYFCLMAHSERDKFAVQEADGHGPLQDFLAAQAAQHRIWLIGGTLPLTAATPDRVLNTVLVYDPSGARVARYDKMHLFAFSAGAEAYD